MIYGLCLILVMQAVALAALLLFMGVDLTLGLLVLGMILQDLFLLAVFWMSYWSIKLSESLQDEPRDAVFEDVFAI